jgi:hypothetical protein
MQVHDPRESHDGGNTVRGTEIQTGFPLNTRRKHSK